MAEAWIDETPEGDWPWEGLEPGPQLAAAVASADVDSLPGEARVSLLKACASLQGWVSIRCAEATAGVAAAVRHSTIDLALPGDSIRDSWVGEEIAAALHVAPTTALRRVSEAEALLHRWPSIGDEVRNGRLTWAQAMVLVEGITVLDGVPDTLPHDDRGPSGDASDRALARVLRTAGRYPPARLRERVRAAVLDVDPESATRRRRQAAAAADVRLLAEDDAMASLWVRTQAPDAVAARNAIADRARELRDAAADPSALSAGQWRVAALLDALGLTPGGVSQPDSSPADPGRGLRDPDRGPVQVHVVVDLVTLLGLADHPGHLEGYGPIDADLARALSTDAEWLRWVSDPVGGYLLDDGNRRFPGARLSRFVRARDARCSHPACGARGPRLDADHVPEHRDGGRTSALSMTMTCAKHNRRRDASGWSAVPDPFPDPYSGPDPHWISPLKQRYRTATPELLPCSPGPHRTPSDPDPPPF